MSKCPNCGCDTNPAQPGNAGERTITLEIPEREWPLWRATLQQMNIKFGMMGNGTMANMLSPWLKKFHDDFAMMRYFGDEKMVLAYMIINNGWPCEVLIKDTERTNAHDDMLSVVTLRFGLEEGHTDMIVSDCAPHQVARDFKSYLEDYIARTTPMEENDA